MELWAWKRGCQRMKGWWLCEGGVTPPQQEVGCVICCQGCGFSGTTCGLPVGFRLVRQHLIDCCTVLDVSWTIPFGLASGPLKCTYLAYTEMHTWSHLIMAKEACFKETVLPMKSFRHTPKFIDHTHNSPDNHTHRVCFKLWWYLAVEHKNTDRANKSGH